jgi:hypothetical protein
MRSRGRFPGGVHFSILHQFFISEISAAFVRGLSPLIRGCSPLAFVSFVFFVVQKPDRRKMQVEQQRTPRTPRMEKAKFGRRSEKTSSIKASSSYRHVGYTKGM